MPYGFREKQDINRYVYGESIVVNDRGMKEKQTKKLRIIEMMRCKQKDKEPARCCHTLANIDHSARFSYFMRSMMSYTAIVCVTCVAIRVSTYSP